MEPTPDPHTPQELQRLLELWRTPGGVLTPDQLRALIGWSGTSGEEREALQASLATTEQHVKATPLAPNQRRGHNSLLDRIRGLLSR